MGKYLQYSGSEFANLTLGQGGFDFVDSTKIAMAGPVPKLAVTKLDDNGSGKTRVYLDNFPYTFTTGDKIILSGCGDDFDGEHSVTAQHTTYVDTDLTYPAIVPILFEHGAYASYIEGEGILYITYPSIDQWSVVQVIAKYAASSTNVVLTDIYGTQLTLDGTASAISLLAGVTIPGRWVQISSNQNLLIAYRG